MGPVMVRAATARTAKRQCFVFIRHLQGLHAPAQMMLRDQNGVKASSSSIPPDTSDGSRMHCVSWSTISKIIPFLNSLLRRFRKIFRVARFTSFIYFVADYFEGLGLFGICRLESLRSRLHKRLRVLRPFPIVFSAPWEKEKVAGFGQRQGVILQRCPLLVGLGRI